MGVKIEPFMLQPSSMNHVEQEEDVKNDEQEEDVETDEEDIEILIDQFRSRHRNRE